MQIEVIRFYIDMSSIPQNAQVSASNEINSGFTFGVRLGLVFIVEASFLSMIAVAGLLLAILVSFFSIPNL